MIEVSGLDREGLLFELTNAISRLNLNIASAHIVTFGERAVDAFYVTDLTGAKIASPQRQAAIKRQLLDVFGGPGRPRRRKRPRPQRLDFSRFARRYRGLYKNDGDSMSDPMNADKKADAKKNQGAAEPSSLSQPSAESDIAQPEPFTELENLYAENAGLKDKLLRALAEVENVRRRAEREVADAKVYGVANFAREMLSFVDNLRRAVESVPEGSRADPAVASLVEGVEVMERDFLARLARFGVKKIEAQGARFDPNQHEALFEIPDETQPAGAVAQVVEQGYMIGERVLRPAKVGVTRSGSKAS